MDWIWDRFWELGVLILSGWVTFVNKKTAKTDERLNELAIDLAKNYVTKYDLEAVTNQISTLDVKIDRLNDSVGHKLDNVNNNILLLMTKKQD